MKLRSFGLRAVFFVVTAVAIGFGLWARSRHFRLMAAEQHFTSMDEGYAAAAIQKPIDPQWEWKFPSAIQMDRPSIEEALPHWRKSMRHAQVRDCYLAAAKRPWIPMTLPTPDPAPPTPLDDDLLEGWWVESVGEFVTANPCLLDGHMGFPAEDNRNYQLTTKLLTHEQYLELAKRFYDRRGLPLWVGKLSKQLVAEPR